MKDDPFFVAYLGVPAGLRRFLLTVAALMILGFGALAVAAGATQDDPGDGAFRFDFGRQEVTGVLSLTPYPHLRIVEGNDRLPGGHTLMLSGGGKRGLMGRAAAMDGAMVTASGVILKRGDLDMMQVRGGGAGLKLADSPSLAAITMPAPEPLGRWRLAGEMCDGKCLAGAMRPGRRMAHKACANLCVIGGVPAVFVSTKPVEGSEYLMLAGPDGGPLTTEMMGDMAAFVTLEGEVTRVGDLLILAVDPATVTPL